MKNNKCKVRKIKNKKNINAILKIILLYLYKLKLLI